MGHTHTSRPKKACLPRALGGWPGYWLQIALVLALLAAMGLSGLNVLAKLAHSTNAPMQHEQYFCFACFCFLFAQQWLPVTRYSNVFFRFAAARSVSIETE